MSEFTRGGALMMRNISMPIALTVSLMAVVWLPAHSETAVSESAPQVDTASTASLDAKNEAVQAETAPMAADTAPIANAQPSAESPTIPSKAAAVAAPQSKALAVPDPRMSDIQPIPTPVARPKKIASRLVGPKAQLQLGIETLALNLRTPVTEIRRDLPIVRDFPLVVGVGF